TRRENAGMTPADPACGPLFTEIRRARNLRPPLVSDILGLMSSTAALSPLMETSTCSFVLRLPINPPLVAAWNLTVKTYSPSAGKLWATARPPWVPMAAAATCHAYLAALAGVELGEVA